MKIQIVTSEKERFVITTHTLRKNEHILSFEHNFVTEPTNKTLRIDEHTHQQSTDSESAENFIDHSCEPNAYIDWSDLTLRALRDIKKGETVTYNYFTSDWDDEDVFKCQCDTPSCKQWINGFKHLPFEERLKIKEFLSPFLAGQLKP
jgi:SET domain-containing protein